MRTTAGELSTMCPPSTPNSEAIFPARLMRSMSSAVRASSSSGRLSMARSATSNTRRASCSAVRVSWVSEST